MPTEDEAPLSSTELMVEVIKNFGAMSDSTIDTQLAQACKAFDPETQDPTTFLRNLRDLAVRYSWGSGFVVSASSAALSTGPEETPLEMEARHTKLETLERDPSGPLKLDRMLSCKP